MPPDSQTFQVRQRSAFQVRSAKRTTKYGILVRDVVAVLVRGNCVTQYVVEFKVGRQTTHIGNLS